jgi:hypothetical protein
MTMEMVTWLTSRLLAQLALLRNRSQIRIRSKQRIDNSKRVLAEVLGRSLLDVLDGILGGVVVVGVVD